MGFRKDKDKLKRKILNYILDVGESTFQSLEGYLRENGIDVCGDYTIELEEYNVVIWIDVSLDFVDAIIELLEEQLLAISVCSILDYNIEDIEFDIIDDFPDEKLVKLSFLPVMITESVDITDIFY